MWYVCENGSDVRPVDVDTTVSRQYVYMRRNIERIEAEGDTPAHYRWEETRIPRDVWAGVEQVMAQKEKLDALAGIVGIMMGVSGDE